MSVSENLEMYLVTIALLTESGLEGPVPLSRLAEELSVQPVSVNQMVRKLDHDGLVNYQPYKGVVLTARGEKDALHIIRHRRLWEVFFVDKLSFSSPEAEALACRMEHITTCDVAQRLYTYLGSPENGPEGKPIPAVDQKTLSINGLRLSEMQAGQIVEVLHVQADDAIITYLDSQGISPGRDVSIAAASSNGALLLDTGSLTISLSAELAEKIRVRITSNA